MTISRGVRIIHKNNTSMESSVTSVFHGVETGRYVAPVSNALAALVPRRPILAHYYVAL
jgi:hypothetical protein